MVRLLLRTTGNFQALMHPEVWLMKIKLWDKTDEIRIKMQGPSVGGVGVHRPSPLPNASALPKFSATIAHKVNLFYFPRCLRYIAFEESCCIGILADLKSGCGNNIAEYCIYKRR